MSPRFRSNFGPNKKREKKKEKKGRREVELLSIKQNSSMIIAIISNHPNPEQAV